METARDNPRKPRSAGEEMVNRACVSPRFQRKNTYSGHASPVYAASLSSRALLSPPQARIHSARTYKDSDPRRQSIATGEKSVASSHRCPASLTTLGTLRIPAIDCRRRGGLESLDGGMDEINKVTYYSCQTPGGTPVDRRRTGPLGSGQIVGGLSPVKRSEDIVINHGDSGCSRVEAIVSSDERGRRRREGKHEQRRGSCCPRETIEGPECSPTTTASGEGGDCCDEMKREDIIRRIESLNTKTRGRTDGKTGHNGNGTDEKKDHGWWHTQFGEVEGAAAYGVRREHFRGR